MEILNIDNLTEVYGKQAEVHALDGVSLTVKKGEFVAIIGPSDVDRDLGHLEVVAVTEQRH